MQSPGRGRWLVWAAGLLLLIAAILGWLTRPRMLAAEDIPAHRADRVNGERLFYAAGCAACHGADLRGGLEIGSAFGIFRVPNISPDPDEGTGNWSDLEFINAMKSGVSPSGGHYYPAFPYGSYTRMNLPDLLDLKAYIETFEPVPSVIPDHDIAFPWSIRRGIGLWKLLYFNTSPVLQVGADDEMLTLGRYLVEAVGHCAECHTPRDRFGGLRRELWLAGGPSPDGEGKVPNITPHADGLQSWSERDIVRYLTSGFTPEYDTVGGSMTEVQENLARLPATDRAAIAAYLKAIPPVSAEHD